MNETTTTSRLRASPMALALLLLSGCSMAPTYERAAIDMPAAFKESPAAESDVQWTLAKPSDDAARGQWWTVFGDASLNALEQQAVAANQDLKAAAARLAQSRSLRKSARSQWWPQLAVAVGGNRQQPSAVSQGLPAGTDTDPFSVWSAQAGVSYEVDLFGRVASGVNAATATQQQSEALFRSVQLALQADVAQGYFLIRELDAEQLLYGSTVALREQALALVQKRFAEGDISELDVARAVTELAVAQSEALGIARRRAGAEHALAVLLGKAPAQFMQPVQPLQEMAVSVPAGLPSALLERRPDIAAAERAMAAANARIGVARAAYFPGLTLSASGGYEAATLTDLFKASSGNFLAGALLSLPVLDGGRRRAGVNRAHAAYEEDVAVYRQTVLNAFREVEDHLAGLRLLAEQSRTQGKAVRAATRAAEISHIQYREGSVSYLDVIETDRSVLQQQRAAVQLQGARVRTSVNLIRALGGGWDQPAASAEIAAPDDRRVAAQVF